MQLASNIENEQCTVLNCTAFLWDKCTLFGATLLKFEGQTSPQLKRDKFKFWIYDDAKMNISTKKPSITKTYDSG